MKGALLLLFTLAGYMCYCQDLTGIWRGHFNQVEYLRDGAGNKIAIPRDRYKFEVQIDQGNKDFSGVTYSYLTTVFYGKATASGTVNFKTKKVVLEELKIVEVRMSGFADACIMTCFMQYTKSGDDEFLEGTYTSMNIRDSSNCGRGTVLLRKVATSDFYKEPFLVNKEKEKPAKKDTVKSEVKVAPKTTPPAKSNTTTKKPTTKPNTNTPPKTSTAKKVPPPVKPPANTNSNPAREANPKADTKIAKTDSVKSIDRKVAPPPITPKVLVNRENELVKTITTDAREITVKLYDNGTIDNDTVSVYLDKKLVLSKKRLTENALTVTLKLDEENSFHELVMVAENLGEIPPNTSLMVVTAGNKQYEVRITSNEQKNAVVIFKYEKN